MPAWVVDTGPLSHFAQAGWLGVLRLLAPAQRILIPTSVEREIRDGLPSRPWLDLVLAQDWIEVKDIESLAETQVFAAIARRLLGPSGENFGECGVVALAEVHGYTAVIDDRVSSAIGRSRGVIVRRTLGLLCEAVNTGKLTLPMVSALADHLLETEYHLPLPLGGFETWARSNGMLTESRD